MENHFVSIVKKKEKNNMMILAIDPKNGEEKCCYTDPVGEPASIYASEEKKSEWLNEKRRFCESNLSLIRHWKKMDYQNIEVSGYYGCEDLPLNEKNKKMKELKLATNYSNGNSKVRKIRNNKNKK